MPTLSLAMIVKNEAALLGHCLESVQGLVDEIVVVDTGSGDGTPALAEAHGAKLSRAAWTDDFSAARNESLRHCTGDWVLVLDADEALDSRDHPAVRAAISAPGAGPFRLIVRNYFPDGAQSSVDAPPVHNRSGYSEGSGFRYYADGRGLRLCPRMEGIAFQGRIHELLDPFFESRGIPIGNLDAVVHHYGKALPGREAAKLRYYLGLAEDEARAFPENPQYGFNLLQQAARAGEWGLALEAAERYMALQPSAPAMVPLAAGMALQAQGRHAEAIPRFDLILAAQPAHALALSRKAASLAALGQEDEAREHLRRALGAHPAFATPRAELAGLEARLGRTAEAREILLAGLAEDPAEPTLLHALVQLSSARGDRAQAVQDAWMALQRCPDGGRGTWHRLVAWALYAEGKPGPALEILKDGRARFPGDAELERLAARIAEGA